VRWGEPGCSNILTLIFQQSVIQSALTTEAFMNRLGQEFGITKSIANTVLQSGL